MMCPERLSNFVGLINFKVEATKAPDATSFMKNNEMGKVVLVKEDIISNIGLAYIEKVEDIHIKYIWTLEEY